jgi:hypothetical protein
MFQSVRKSSAHLREVTTLIGTDATGFVRFRLLAIKRPDAMPRFGRRSSREP